MSPPKALLSWSTGKDSAYTLHVARAAGEVEVVGLLTTVTAAYDRVSMHGVRRALLERQAAAAGLPLTVVDCDRHDMSAVAEGLVRQLAEPRFDYAAGWPLRAGLVVVDGHVRHIALAASHAAMDANAADVVVRELRLLMLRGGIAGLPKALRLARATLRTIHQNLFWAFVYNLIGIPLAAGVLYPLTGWSLSPVFASAAMSLSSVSVIANSLRLRKFGRASEASQLPSVGGPVVRGGSVTEAQLIMEAR